MKKAICCLLFLTACVTSKNSSIIGKPILTKDLPITVRVSSPHLAKGFENKLIEAFNKLGYQRISSDEIQQLLPIKAKDAYNKHKLGIQKANSKEERAERIEAMMKDESLCWYSSVYFKLSFQVDTINNIVTTDTASVRVTPMPYIDNRSFSKNKTYFINPEHLKTKSLDNILYMLIDSITLPRK